MTTERWTDERLDQLAQLVESNARQIEANSRQIEANSRLIESNSRTIQALADLAAEERQERAAILESIREIQQEVRGLQTENRRILDILLNERRDEAAD
ncbi:hypothetical protein OOK60_14070 [Trichothermofontia sichuanensis B231]|uniref:hypothetical protein n=1 Tax=Trichothermofontia sichuanensis TaxID=3045816 RepID=UPI0022467F5D|nr:hypothetical protein [Trichothermofontia sichuanensis]UZQ53614.1 hypothetical protein OOK60_14070 [Trichothermofontia sichuanensis B231]